MIVPRSIHRCLTILAIAATCVAIPTRPVVGIDTRTLDEIYTVAQTETGPLRVQVGGSANSAAAFIVTAWEKRFPKVALNLTVNLSKYTDSLIDRAFDEGYLYTDIAFLESLQDFPRWKREMRLLEYKPPTWADINDAIKDFDGAWVAGQIYSFGPFYYDATRVPADKVPKNYLDILDPWWKGKMVIEWPNDDPAVAYLFSLIIGRYGWSWLEAFVKQDVLLRRGAAGPAYTIAAGNSSRVMSFTTLGYPPDPSVLTRVNPEFPEQYMSWSQLMAIFAETPRPESARLFEAWFLSDEFQSTFGAGPSVRNKYSNTREGNIWSMNNTQVPGYTEFLLNAAEMGRWLNQFETTFGEPVGPDPVLVFTNPV